MNDQMGNYDTNFFQLVFSLQAGAMQQMGKVASPLSGKVERDLTLAKARLICWICFREKLRAI